jgi:hypothetical protein
MEIRSDEQMSKPVQLRLHVEQRQHLACKASKQRHPTPACKAGHACVQVQKRWCSTAVFINSNKTNGFPGRVMPLLAVMWG